jgi:5-methylcytosine-specific restriction endonuclease McrA
MSQRRAARRHQYAAYLASPQWQARRRRWLRNQQRHGIDPVCVVCGKPWTLDDDLHHASYANLGHEPDSDLTPMCRGCHEALHRILDTSRAWRAMPWAAATTGIITILRSRGGQR